MPAEITVANARPSGVVGLPVAIKLQIAAAKTAMAAAVISVVAHAREPSLPSSQVARALVLVARGVGRCEPLGGPGPELETASVPPV